MLPQLSDLDTERLSTAAREALADAHAIYVDGQDADEVAAARGISRLDLQQRIELLAAEWRDHAGAGASLPRLSEEEYEALRDSIREHGQLVPILAHKDGNVIDGRARLRVCRELNVEPRIEYLDEPAAEEQNSLALVVNLARRQLTAGARRGIVRDELLRDAGRSDRAIASGIGVSHPTVAAVRRELQQHGTVESLSTRVGRDGVAQPAGKPASESGVAEHQDLPDGLVEVTLRLTPEHASALDGGAWLDCRAARLLLVDAGVYMLELRR